MGHNSKRLSLLFKDFYNQPLQVSQASVTVDDSPSPKHALPSANALLLLKLFLYLELSLFPPSPMLAHKRPVPLKGLIQILLSPRSLRSPKVNWSFLSPNFFAWLCQSTWQTRWELCLLICSLSCMLDSEDFESIITQIWFISETPEVMSFFTEWESEKIY